MIDLRSLWDIVVLLAIALAAAPFFGEYLGKVYTNRPMLGDVVLAPLERGIYRLLGTSPRKSMPARECMAALLLVNGAVLAYLFWYFFLQAGLPYDPTGVPNMSWDLALHSASSFTTNTDFTHFTNESQISFGALILGWQLALFVSAATGLAVFAAMVRGFIRKDGTLGNYYVDMVRTMTRVLIPLAVIGALVMVLLGVPETLTATVIAHPITGGTQTIYLGPVASYQSISLIGTNGGGWYSANMASPFANPSAVSDLFAVFLMLLIPLSTPFAFAQIIRRRNEAWPYLGTILIVLMVALTLFIVYQAASNPALASCHRAGDPDQQRVSGRPGNAVRPRQRVALSGGERLQQRRCEQHDDRGAQPREPDGPSVRDVHPEHARRRRVGVRHASPVRRPRHLRGRIDGRPNSRVSREEDRDRPRQVVDPRAVDPPGHDLPAVRHCGLGRVRHPRHFRHRGDLAQFHVGTLRVHVRIGEQRERALDRSVHRYHALLQCGRGARHARGPVRAVLCDADGRGAVRPTADHASHLPGPFGRRAGPSPSTWPCSSSSSPP